MIKSLSNVPTPLKMALFICTIIYLCLKLWLNKLPEIFENANEVSDLVSQICLTIITGYFFYVIVNQIKEDKDKINMKEFIRTRIENIYISYNTICTQMYKATNFSTSLPPSKSELKELLTKIEMTRNLPDIRLGPPVNRTITWFELLINEQEKAKKEISRLLNTPHLIDTELIMICTKIEDSNYFFWLDQMKQFGIDFKQFSDFTNYFHEHALLCTELQKYAFNNDFIKADKKELKLIKKIINEGISKSEIESFKNNKNS
jgi:hypothetical protein